MRIDIKSDYQFYVFSSLLLCVWSTTRIISPSSPPPPKKMLSHYILYAMMWWNLTFSVRRKNLHFPTISRKHHSPKCLKTIAERFAHCSTFYGLCVDNVDGRLSAYLGLKSDTRCGWVLILLLYYEHQNVFRAFKNP